MVNLTLHLHFSCVGRDDFAKLNRNASAANLIQMSIPAVASASVLHSAAVDGSVVGVVRPL